MSLAAVDATCLVAQQLAVGDPLEDYVRLLQIVGKAPLGPMTIRPIPLEVALTSFEFDSQHPWRARYVTPLAAGRGEFRYTLADPEVESFWHSHHPVARNDGPVWQGKGATLELSAGGTARYGPLAVTLRPTLFYSQNRSFDLVDVSTGDGGSAFRNPWHTQQIDLPQRFGAQSFWDVDLGQSGARLDIGVGSVGAGTENMWWGPGMRNAIVISNSGPGFPHAFLALSRPVDVGIGTLEAKWIWGRLAESEYFDSVSTNDARFVTGLVFDFQPKPIPGLFLGASRLFYELIPPGGLDFSEYFLAFQGITKGSQQDPANPSGNDLRDQLISLFARWVFPESGMEAFVEWSRNDHSQDLRDFLVQPGHAEGYTLGFQKAFTLGETRIVRLHVEHTRLEKSKTLLDRPTPTYYVHSRVPQGYTHRGQLVGAAVGPGGNSQFLGVDMFASWGRVGAFLLREVHDNDAFYDLRSQGLAGLRQNDVETSLGVTTHLFVSRFDIDATLSVARELNRYYIDRNDVANVSAQVAFSWRLGR